MIVKKYVNEILNDLPDRRLTFERPAEFMKGNVRNDLTPNDSFGAKVIMIANQINDKK